MIPNTSCWAPAGHTVTATVKLVTTSETIPHAAELAAYFPGPEPALRVVLVLPLLAEAETRDGGLPCVAPFGYSIRASLDA